jgi:uncharacterized protein (DUF305 family)
VSAGGQAGAAFSQQDADFASAMIPHHEQALTTAELAVQRASSNEVKEVFSRPAWWYETGERAA